MALTVKQEKFCQLVVETGNQAEAYRQAYSTEATKKTCTEEASRLMTNPKITAMVDSLKDEVKSRHNVTVDSLLQELEEARTIALTSETPQSSAAVTATMGKAKLCGLDKQVIDHNIKIVDDGSNEW